ncbi:MAG: 16S rRNA (cytidine(1402)-2'-O)-methyltransferase [Chitinispirillaceae bacterium]|nr:16S rRNA (cytidine(1402)-2'-O)-methyltransferase [Chitinispirillaceae bacterium]
MATLFLVATPIGNLGDISFRAVQILKQVPVILAEDTRVSRTLCAHAGISTPLLSYHDFNKERVTPAIIARLQAGEDMALITDAGTPGIADPAFNLVRAAVAAGVTITPIPGACAFISALVGSGLPTDRFLFENFLPVKSGARRRLLESFGNERRTVIFYETPHRIIRVLEDINESLGDVLVVIAREMTKIHEEFMRGTSAELQERFRIKPPRGEMTVLFNTRVRGKEEKKGPSADGPCEPVSRR